MRLFSLVFWLMVVALTRQVDGQQTAANTLKTAAPQIAPAVLYSPDHQHYAAWFDVNPGQPVGETRPVVFRLTSAPWDDLFSFVTVPGHTQAAWNLASTRCVIGDQPNDGEVFAWLVYADDPNHWHGRRIDPVAPVEAAYRRVMGDKSTPLFRPYLDKIEWLTDSKARFLIWCNLGGHTPAEVAGRYYVTIDFQAPDAAPTMMKIADQ